MVWESYNLDREAQKLVLKYRDKEVLNESHKMRVTVAYGLERFWGEHLRLMRETKTKDKGEYWKDTWKTFAIIMAKAGVEIPNDDVSNDDTQAIQTMAEKFWDQEQFSLDDQRIALAILTQLCDSLVWWTQRYKKPSSGGKS